MFALRTCANIVSFLLVTKSEIGAERVPIWEASGKCSGGARRARSLADSHGVGTQVLGAPWEAA